MPAFTKDKAVKFLLWIIFVSVLGYLKLAHHELWKDEWQAWFVAKDKSLGDIFSFLYYEGHPALWYIYLKIFTLFTGLANSVVLISVAHLMTVAAGLYFLLVKSRLPFVLPILLSLSYFIFFEYGLVNRGYFLVITFVLWAAWLLRKEHYSRSEMGIILFLLCQTEVYGTLMAIALGFYIFLNEEKKWSWWSQKDIVGLMAGFVVFIISVFPRASGHVARTRGKELDFVDNALTSWQGNLSNTYMIGSTPDTFTYGWSVLGIVLSVICLAGLFIVFKPHKKLMLTFGFFVVMMMSFSFFIFLGGIRQWGMGFVFFIAMLEIRGFDIKKEWLAGVIIGVFCLFNVIHGVKAVKEDIKIPFTNAEKTGWFIRDKIPPRVPVVAINKFEATPVVGYADRKFFELPDGSAFSYFRWVDKIYIPTENELKLYGKFKSVGGIVVLSPTPLDSLRYPTAKLWQKFDQLSYKNENYYLYSLPVK